MATVLTDLAFFQGATGGNSSCDSLTDWTGTGLAVDTVQFIQGTGSIYSYSAASTTTRYWNFSCVSTNVQNKAIYFWFALGKVGWLNTKANGGLTLKVTDSSGNWALWNVAGRDTLPHNGFICHCVHTSRTPDSQSSTPPNLQAITSIEIRANGSFPGKAYLWLDAVRYGTGLRIYGGDSNSPATFEDFYLAESDVNNQWGVLTKVNEIYFVQGQLTIGDTSYSTYFKDTNQVVVYKDALVVSGFYKLNMIGSNTQVYLGEKVSNNGISGCTIRATSNMNFELNISSEVYACGIYGCSIARATPVNLSSNTEILNTLFTSCGTVYPNGATIKNSYFISCSDRAVSTNSVANFEKNVFLNNYIGIKLTQTGEYTFKGLQFSGNTYDIENPTSGHITVYNTEGSNASTYINTGGGTTTIITSAIHRLIGLKQNSEVTYVRRDTGEIVFHVENVDESGITEFSYDATNPFYVDILIFHTNYLPIYVDNVYLGPSGGEIPISQVWDRNYYNP